MIQVSLTRVLLGGLVGFTLGLSQLWSDPVSKNPEIVWVFEQLEQHPVAADEDFLRWRERVFETLPKLEHRSFTGVYVNELDPRELTSRNADYWRSIVKMGSDGVILLWLHGLLLEQRSDNVEAYVWARIVRQTTVLTEEFDQRWLRWEQRMLPKSKWVDSRDSEPPRVWNMHRPRSLSAISRIGRVFEGRSMILLERSQVSTEAALERINSSALPERDNTKNELSESPAIQGALHKIGASWPYIPLLDQSELVATSSWLKKHGSDAEALVFLLNSRSQKNEQDWLRVARLFANLTGEEIAPSALADFAQGLADDSKFGAKESDGVSEGEWVHAHLIRDALQQSRRLALLLPKPDRWVDSKEFLHTRLANFYLVLRQDEALEDVIDRMRVSRSTRVTWRLHLAILRADRDQVEKCAEKLTKFDPKMTLQPSAHGLAAMYLGDWPRVIEIFAYRWANAESRKDWESAAFFALHTYLIEQIAGAGNRGKLEQALAKVSDESWIRRLGQTALGEITQSEILAAANEGSEFEIAGRLCEVHTVLAFTLAGNLTERRKHLLASLATGRNDFIEYRIARFALRDLEMD